MSLPLTIIIAILQTQSVSAPRDVVKPTAGDRSAAISAESPKPILVARSRT
jgi:hypothetical protein